MNFLLLLTLLALGLTAQTLPKAKIIINITDDAGNVTTAKITGIQASAGLDILNQWMATQVICSGEPQVCIPKFANAAEAAKEFIIAPIEQIAPKFPSSQTKSDVDEITAKIAALEAKRKKLFEDARKEK